MAIRRPRRRRPLPSGGNGFTQGVKLSVRSQAQFWFKPSGWTASYAIVHYTIAGQNQQNLTMTYNSGAGQWQYTGRWLRARGHPSPTRSLITRVATSTILGHIPGRTVGGSATPTPTPITCTNGSFHRGVANTGATTALILFQPCGWTAGYVILHYSLPGQYQQNINMTYNSGAGRWEYSVGGFSAGQTVTFSFTYQQNGTQFDSGTYTWTHP